MQFHKDISLKSHNTFGLEAKTKLFTEVNSIVELQETLKTEEAQANPLLILGGGSNILLTQDFDGLTIKNTITGKSIIKETDDYVLVKVGAGEAWHDFVTYAIEQNWGGTENLSLIPGTVGAAPMQNIGAYGIELKEIFESLEAVNIETGEIETFNQDQCQFGYRESIFKKNLKGKYIIAHVTFRLTRKDHQLHIEYGAIKSTLEELKIKSPTIEDISNAVISIRKSKLPDPKEIGNSGSFFKNPTITKISFESLKVDHPEIPGYELPNNEVKVPAGWLIEKAGWKGYTNGNIGVHKKQALVLVNYGGGKGKDIWALAEEIQASVMKKFGIELHPEVNII
ncbi:UDP-N-acetylmuramate dehydrogenase [Fulvivirga sediminis]|uniref:UDP-N-acetylenolpyruvoylglucosamine reductase n=1 Tax=Fulvivirga sediminis TaxID=2803949 RepID=A0A937K097_9BACT|nr:UDP-N-acetylmuramate dehydrogenase [Fulvivirga sediminis]MBL3658148.1 UDP-N-acetylmuramate dehydrogenase [Fulvivirga sediminis]